MIGPGCVDDIDCGSFFDQIEDILDFPVDDVDAALPVNADTKTAFSPIWPTHSEIMPASDGVFSANSNSDLSAELSVPYEDIVQLEWLSNFVEDSFSGGSLTMNKEADSPLNNGSSRNQFQTSSPVSVLESSSSCSGDKTLPNAFAHSQRGRPRTKRSRPATFNSRAAMQLISPSSSVTATEAHRVPSDSENFAESRPKQGDQQQQKKKKKKVKLSVPLAPLETNQNGSVRKCMHCEITKTPQWRAGPIGPKTLCNACGVRYKSGRLFPEYRPAASPTFVPSLHSNSHKKVLEMRSKAGDNEDMVLAEADSQSMMEFVPNTNSSSISLGYI